MPQRPRSLNPDASALAKFGVRLRAYRMEQGWAQAELGRLVHVSGTLIAKMERAERRPQPDVARSLDSALHTDGELARLAADALRDHLLSPTPQSLISPSGLRPTRNHAAFGAGWEQEMTELAVLADRYDLPEDGRIRTLAELQASVDQLVRWRLNSDYARLLQAIPQLIPELTRALLTSTGKEREDVAVCLVQAWRAADAIAAKLGMFDLSARLILVMGWAAAQSGNGLAMAATSYVRAETFFVSGQQQAGHLMLERAAEQIDAGGSRREAAQYGALHMRAAIAAARAGLTERVKDHLTEAWSMAERVEEEGVWEGTAFGPASVRVHEVSTAVELDTPQTALAAAAGWQPPDSLPAERRSHFFVDLARAQLALGEHEAVLRTLREAHTIAPQNVQVDLQVHQTLASLAAISAANASAAEGFRQVVARTKAGPISLELSSPFQPGGEVRAILPASAPPSPPSG
jgi:transcriptional regulator with XRE-family HTH domain